MTARSSDQQRPERGSAIVEFVALAVLMMIPLVYLVLMLARLEAGAFAVTQAAREAGRAFVTADSDGEAYSRAAAAATISFQDFRFGPESTLSVQCTGSPCLSAGSAVVTTATVQVPLPLVPAFVRDVVPLSVPVTSSHRSTVDEFRSF